MSSVAPREPRALTVISFVSEAAWEPSRSPKAVEPRGAVRGTRERAASFPSMSSHAVIAPCHRTNAQGNHLMHIIGIIIIGFLAGLVAKLLTPGRDPGGFIVTTLLGIVGAFVASWLGQAIGWYGPDEGAGFIGAVVGAIIVLAVYHATVGRRAV
jgi:uncharacterized membrane protein YeaQ/YmgE (transglycosylase-associated protein family)